uniref:DNA mismatch repair proteins mutS family domain-containing protein n=1 Tax=Bombyx mori TaxID=7091 RepID=A0A8R2QYN0_BOMMO|nr:mutS protein homolog 4 [Bombyx mori]
MNVVHREITTGKNKTRTNFTADFARRDASLGIRGTSLLPVSSYCSASKNTMKGPRYQFDAAVKTSTKRSSMGPPSRPPPSSKKRLISSISSRLESSSSGRQMPAVLANDSTADTSNDMRTPRNRPTALRYISSSSRGGYSGARSGRSTSVSAVEASVILAISEGRGMARGEIGMAAVDLKHPHLVLCQFSDTLLYTHTLTKINYFNPVEVMRHFNDSAGRQNIQTLCAPQYSGAYLQNFCVRNFKKKRNFYLRFYALTAAAAVLKYVEHIQCIVFARESLKVDYHSSENTMIIDVGTATQLELVQPLVPSAGPMCCLLGVLGPTYTVGGIRALRASILQPSCNKQLIESKLDVLQDLIENDNGLMADLQDILKRLSDIDKILFLCVEHNIQNADKLGEAQLNQVLILKTTMNMVPKLVEALNRAESGLLRQFKTDFENPHYNEIAERIKNIIQDDAHFEKGVMGNLQRCFAVKPDINGLLDVARRTYSELIDDIQKIVEQLSETYDLPLRLNQNVMKGFHIVLPIAPKNRRNFSIEDLPPIFIQVSRYVTYVKLDKEGRVHNNGASVSMSTEELVVLDQQAKESLNEIQRMSNIVIDALLKDLRPYMSSLYKLCENVAEIDILLALAQVRIVHILMEQKHYNSYLLTSYMFQASMVGSYIRPEFNSYLEIRNSVHPLLDYNSHVMPVPNDINASPEYNFTIITGPNMGGKSVYIKQIAIMHVMAQIGCFLPATNAVLRLSDRIFSRIGFNDSVELNASTFVFEMKEMQHILKGLTPSSLVIIDELCRGTTYEEGVSIAWAICEELILSDAFTFFTTHFLYLTKLQHLYYNVVNRHTTVKEENVDELNDSHKKLIYEHKIELGVTNIKNYGLALAAKTNLPEDTVKLAFELAELMTIDEETPETCLPQRNDERELYILNAELQKEYRKNGGSEKALEATINKFKENNAELVEKLKIQTSNNPSSSSNECWSSDPKKGYSNNPSGSGKKPLEYNRTPERLNTESLTVNEKPGATEIYPQIKSSNELLTSMKTIKNKSHTYIDEDIQTIGIENVNTKLNKLSPNCLNESNHYIEEYQNTLSTEHENSLSDDDLSEALTQVIGECSNSFDHSIDNEDRATDETLMIETINEINEELNNASNYNFNDLILTPPIAFRDIS